MKTTLRDLCCKCLFIVLARLFAIICTASCKIFGLCKHGGFADGSVSGKSEPLAHSMYNGPKVTNTKHPAPVPTLASVSCIPDTETCSRAFMPVMES
jgi:hypothetical protein